MSLFAAYIGGYYFSANVTINGRNPVKSSIYRGLTQKTQKYCNFISIGRNL